MTQGAMNKVRLGRTDLMVTSICFGISGLGDMPDTYGCGVDDARAKATMHAILMLLPSKSAARLSADAAGEATKQPSATTPLAWLTRKPGWVP
jgi:hypothetical protein